MPPQQPMQQPMQQQPMPQAAPQQPMMQQPMGQQMPPQQPMMQQPMGQQMPPQQPMMQQPMGGQSMGGPGKMKFDLKDPKSLIMLIPVAMVAILVLVLLFNLVTTRTLKCNSSDEDEGVVTKTTEKVKFKFGHISSRYSKMSIDFSKSDYDKEDIKDQIDSLKSIVKNNCKSKDGCKYSIQDSSKKITITVKQKYDKDTREKFEDVYDNFEDYKEDFEKSCDD